MSSVSRAGKYHSLPSAPITPCPTASSRTGGSGSARRRCSSHAAAPLVIPVPRWAWAAISARRRGADVERVAELREVVDRNRRGQPEFRQQPGRLAERARRSGRPGRRGAGRANSPAYGAGMPPNDSHGERPALQRASAARAAGPTRRAEAAAVDVDEPGELVGAGRPRKFHVAYAVTTPPPSEWPPSTTLPPSGRARRSRGAGRPTATAMPHVWRTPRVASGTGLHVGGDRGSASSPGSSRTAWSRSPCRA